MDEIKSVYTMKAEGTPDYYLGNDYKRDKKGRLCIGSKKYIKEVLNPDREHLRHPQEV